MIDRSFSWLGRFPLAVDLADTVRVVGSNDVELLVDEEALSVWIAAEFPRFPSVAGASGHLSRVIELRDAVRALLTARVRDESLPRRERDLINDASRRSPSFPTIDETTGRVTVEVNDDPYDMFAAAVARSTMEVLTREADVAECRAPSCGMLFEPANRRQRWCSPACGNRARVARHAARTS